MSRKGESFDPDVRRLELFDAIDGDNAEGVLSLINHVPTEHRRSWGDTALLRAAQSARPNIIESILNNVGALDTVEKDQPLLHAVLALSTTRASGAPVTEDQVIKSVQLLLGAGANPRCVDQNKMNPAMLGVLKGSDMVVDTVIAAVEDSASYVLETNNAGSTLLSLAFGSSSLQMVQRLVGLGSHVDDAVLEAARASHRPNIVQYIVDCIAQGPPPPSVLAMHLNQQNLHREPRSRHNVRRTALLCDFDAEDGEDAPLPLPPMSHHQGMEIALNIARHCGDRDGRATAHIRTSAEGSDDLAIACYALLRWLGSRGVLRDRDEAHALAHASMTWLRSPVARELPFARYLLGVFLHQGIGIPQSRGAGKQHLLWAAKHGNTSAMMAVSELHSLCGNTQEARRLLRCAAGLHHTPAMLTLGAALSVSRSAAEREEAGTLISRAAQLGDVLAMRKMGEIYAENGQDDDAIAILQKTADLNDLPSLHLLSCIRSRIYGTHGRDKDLQEAARLMEAAADGGYGPALVPAALYCLFHHHHHHHHHQVDEPDSDEDEPDSDEDHNYFKEAVRYLRAAVQGRDPAGFFWLAYCLEHGKGIAHNPTAAIAHYNWACSLGHLRASIIVAFLCSFNANSLHTTDTLLSMIEPILLKEGVDVGLERLPVMLYFDEQPVNGSIPVRFHFLNADGTLSTECHDKQVSQQVLLTAAPVLMTAHAQVKLAEMRGGAAVPGLDSAMELVQIPPTVEGHEIQEHVWTEQCDEAVRAAWDCIVERGLGAEGAEPDVSA